MDFYRRRASALASRLLPMAVVAMLGGILAAEDRAGPAVLLKSGQVIFGAAQQEGDRVIVTNATSTVRLDRKQVACWADSLRAVYQYRIDQRPEGSVTHLIADAQWCLENQLLEEVEPLLLELRTAATAQRDVKILEARLTAAREMSRQRMQNLENPIQQAAFVAPVELSPLEARRLGRLFEPVVVQRFAADVQPVLMNRCATAGCHGPRPASPPHLEGWNSGVTASITRRNLQSLAPYLNTAAASESKLLTKANMPHSGSSSLSGGLDAPLRQRLRQWIDLVYYEPTSSTTPAAVLQDANLEGSEDLSYQATGTLPQKLPQVTDPFDPEIFNRGYRP